MGWETMAALISLAVAVGGLYLNFNKSQNEKLEQARKEGEMRSRVAMLEENQLKMDRRIDQLAEIANIQEKTLTKLGADMEQFQNLLQSYLKRVDEMRKNISEIKGGIREIHELQNLTPRSAKDE